MWKGKGGNKRKAFLNTCNPTWNKLVYVTFMLNIGGRSWMMGNWNEVSIYVSRKPSPDYHA